MARDWSTFSRRITVDYPARAIYEAWAVPSQIERWFLRSAEYVSFDGTAHGRDLEVEAGDSYVWGWHGHSDDANESGLVMEANGSDRFAFSFAGGSIVTVAIKNEPDTCIVELVQNNISDSPERDIYVNCSYGWTFYLANLKSILEGGIDLRNKDVGVSDVVNS
ncbi:MAG: SRPBCC domain-containing protein [Acidobacteriota bacterium]